MFPGSSLPHPRVYLGSMPRSWQNWPRNLRHLSTTSEVMVLKLQGKKALVTGGAGGIGQGCALG